MNDINFKLRKELTGKIPELLKCFQCGTCVSSCPAEKYGKAFSPRRKILAALYGDEKIINKELWKCVTCNSCNERCPQDVNPYKVLIKLKNYAIKNNLVEESLKDQEQLVKKTGFAIPITDRANRQREKLGLKKLNNIKILEDFSIEHEEKNKE
ncbi:4Fe-4S dicluster domain-containing protein [Candidatus Woesearchaeota archaeon]|nr:4Fe-4S dicluster domain-containing protein [Candidatus Woesearchaeota archaeon]